MLTKKDYKLIAKAVNESQLSAVDKRIIVSKLCRAFINDNARFNADYFVDACYEGNDNDKLKFQMSRYAVP